MAWNTFRGTTGFDIRSLKGGLHEPILSGQFLWHCKQTQAKSRYNATASPIFEKSVNCLQILTRFLLEVCLDFFKILCRPTKLARVSRPLGNYFRRVQTFASRNFREVENSRNLRHLLSRICGKNIFREHKLSRIAWPKWKFSHEKWLKSDKCVLNSIKTGIPWLQWGF